jgi:2-methylisocitrate lyase-like PEP mutase family enzyme
MKHIQYGPAFRQEILDKNIVPVIGVYDALSASLSSKYFNAVFCSGYGFSASRYGLPDEGFIAWQDMISYVENMRSISPDLHIVVDIDDGYGDDRIARTVTSRLENIGASAIILEDQRRPKKCGHLPGKEIISRDEYIKRLTTVLNVRKDLYVIARTDAHDLQEGISRVQDYARAGADAVMVEGLDSYESIKLVRESIPSDVSMVVNLISGGKMDPISLDELDSLGVNLVIYSTPCLFAAHSAVDNAIRKLKENNGVLEGDEFGVSLSESNKILVSNLISECSK